MAEEPKRVSKPRDDGMTGFMAQLQREINSPAREERFA
jgi:hypothetical protein